MAPRRPLHPTDDLDVAPDEEGFSDDESELLDELDDDGDDEEAVQTAPPPPAAPPVAAPARSNGRNGHGNGRGAAPERRVAIADVPTAAAPSPAAFALPPEDVGYAPGVDLTLGQWLSRRWVYGLTYWQSALVVLLAIALVLTRFYNVGDRAMHHDESMHAKFAWDTFHGQIYKYNPLLHGPFQFLAVASSFWLFGATEAPRRSASRW
jgi:hypothetical protein